jgi:hypothetical protein
VDRDAHARAARRRQALDALEFERDRAAMLEEQLEDTAARIDGARIDAGVYARMSSDDVELVRTAFGEDLVDPVDPDADELPAADEPDGGEAASMEELARLGAELASSRRLQAALQRYVDELAAGSSP